MRIYRYRYSVGGWQIWHLARRHRVLPHTYTPPGFSLTRQAFQALKRIAGLWLREECSFIGTWLENWWKFDHRSNVYSRTIVPIHSRHIDGIHIKYSTNIRRWTAKYWFCRQISIPRKEGNYEKTVSFSRSHF